MIGETVGRGAACRRLCVAFVVPSAEINYSEIVDARALTGRIFSVIELSCTRADVDGAMFGTMNRRFEFVVQALNDRGVTFL